MKRLGAAIFVSAAVLFVAAGAAMWTNSTWAAERSETVAPPVQLLKAGDPDDEDADKTPYVGIRIHTVSSEEAKELGVSGPVRVLGVDENGPASGLLEAGDVIVSVGGVTVTTSRHVVRIVQATDPGEILSFTVVRDGNTEVVDVEVGERDVKAAARLHFALPHQLPGPLQGLLHNLNTGVARAEIVVHADGGFETLRAVAGTMSNIDVENGTFDLSPEDGSDAISYQISDETVVLSTHNDLGGLNETDRTWVVDVDSNVKLVTQGQMPFGPQPGGQGFFHPFGGSQLLPHGGGLTFPFGGPPATKFRFERTVPREYLERLDDLGHDIPARLREMLERLERERASVSELNGQVQ